MNTVTITVNKAKSESSGLFLFKDEQNRIIINSIFSGPFKDTELQSFMQILSIDGKSCTAMDEGTVKSLLDSSSGQVTVVAQPVIYSAEVVDGRGSGGGSGSAPHPSAPVDLSTNSNNPPPTVPSCSQSQQPAYNVHQAIVPVVQSSTNDTTPLSNAGNPPRGCQAGGRWATIKYNGDKTKILCVVLAGNPPQGCQAGGRWATIKYNGDKTKILCVVLALCFGIYSGCGTCAFLCPLDNKDVYIVNGNVYNHVGKFLGKVSQFKFS
eukprot:CAMPEP_0203711914 /NCGR_PEP_ID=MMETSP0091-20130426/69763_1 /ASSEMBLY_ACC=CAM_ASM_001089 /TAXON_ID=426623 /ORGANISM="Chaetoceros affinis, Strain CCMP159" /LENGTH=265 /DNA_ID=CAMNT_0050589867 /DNA_START=3 /DNA_END=800 /DNA_ORIENTATION=-